MSVKLREGVMAVVFAAFDDSMKEVLALVNKTAYNITLACMSCRDDLLFWQPLHIVTFLRSSLCVCMSVCVFVSVREIRGREASGKWHVWFCDKW